MCKFEDVEACKINNIYSFTIDDLLLNSFDWLLVRDMNAELGKQPWYIIKDSNFIMLLSLLYRLAFVTEEPCPQILQNFNKEFESSKRSIRNNPRMVIIVILLVSCQDHSSEREGIDDQGGEEGTTR